MSVRLIAEAFVARPHTRDGLGPAAALVAAILARRAEHRPADLAAILLAVLRDRVFADLEDPTADPTLGAPRAVAVAPAPGDPRPGLDLLNVPWVQDTDPGYGYDGTFQPAMAFLHWTASAAGTDTARSVLEARHYHACAARDGTAHLGGWMVRQGHGGTGRTGPQSLARQGAMTLEDLTAWHRSTAGDDTDDGANRYGVAVCLDNNGVGEVPNSRQWQAFTATAAAVAWSHGWSIGNLIDHDASTARKIDLGSTSAFPPSRYWNDIQTQLTLLQKGPAAVTTAVDLAATPQGGYYVLASDGAVFSFGPGAAFHGAANDGRLGSEAVALQVIDGGYRVLEANGGIHAFGKAGLYTDANGNQSAYPYLQ